MLIEKSYNVVGTVRTNEKGENLKKCLNSENFKYEVVSDISVEGAFDDALKRHPEVSVLLHTASPFFYDTTDPENDLVVPAIKGTTNVLKAIKDYGPQIERVVITSSDAAIYSMEDERNTDLSLNETNWNSISYEDAIKDPIAAYYGAKTFAEKAAWDYVKENDVNFKLTAVNPVYVFGPQAFASEVKSKLNTSNELINTLIKLGPTDQFDNDTGGFIDVRDVAKAHLLAFENENTINKRLYLTNGHFSTQMMLDIINKNIPELKGKIPSGNPGTGEQDILTLANTNNEATRQLLNFDFVSLEDIVVDTVKQILNNRSA